MSTPDRHGSSRMRLLGLLGGLVAAATLFFANAATAAAAPAWEVKSMAPTHVTPGSTFMYSLVARNAGDAPTDGPVTIVDSLPAGLTATQLFGGGWDCTLATLTCTGGFADPGRQASRVSLGVAVAPDASGTVVNSVTISGGGAAQPATDTSTTTITTTPPGFGIYEFGGDLLANEFGEPATQAASHPYSFTSTARLNSSPHPANGLANPNGSGKTFDVDLPRGLVGDPSAVSACPREVFSQPGQLIPCPLDSQIGIVRVTVGAGDAIDVPIPLYNLEPPPGLPAQFGFKVLDFNVVANPRVRTGGDYGLSYKVVNISNFLPLSEITVTLWGVPADPSHDGQRGGPCLFGAAPCDFDFEAPLKPFLTSPTDCSGPPLTTTLRTDPWQNPGVFETASFNQDSNGAPIAVQGCDKVPFDPNITLQPTSHAADSPTGLEVNLTVPQGSSPDALAQAHLKRAVVTLPEGMSVSPAAADGLGACSPAQIGLDNPDPVTCPDSAKIGTVEVKTPLLPDPLTGDIYVAKQQDNPFNSLLAIYLVVRGPGVLIKLPGEVTPDPQTGRLTATFDDNPQLPFSSFKLSFFGGPRAPLVNPPICGAFQTHSELSPWSAADPDNPTPDEIVEIDGSFDITSGPGGAPCSNTLAERPFAPGFSAGTVHPLAGAFSPFVLRATRADGEQELKRIAADLPPGLVGHLAGIPACPESALASISTAPGTGADEASDPACPAGSQVGTARVGAGAGASPFFIPGKVYLTGPYNGAPLGLAIVTPALAGPFDLGTVVVRSALFVDQDDAQVQVLSDVIPHILEGIPLRIRDIRVNMNRPGFILNPTNCNPMAVTGQLTGAGGDLASAADDTLAPVSQHFQVGGCGGLGFSPKLTGAILNGKDGIHRSDHPNLSFNLHGTAGDANLARVEVLLPSAFQIDQANLGNICSEANLAANRCAGKNTIGSATATTPLLDTPLSGPVYAVSGSGGLPRLAVILRGPASMPIELIIRGDTTTEGARIRNTFATVPDAPVTDFDLNIAGGDAGYLVNNTNICTKKAKKKAKKNRKRIKIYANATFTGQNGDTLRQKVKIGGACSKKKKGKKSKKRRRR